MRILERLGKKENVMNKCNVWVVLLIFTVGVCSFGESYKKDSAPTGDSYKKDSAVTSSEMGGRQGVAEDLALPRRLASGDAEEDLNHYKNLGRRLGVDIGMFIPMGDFQKVYETAPAIGVHFVWEAIPPFAFTMGMHHVSAPTKADPGTGKLTVTSIHLGTQISCFWKRFSPFVKLDGAFYFNNASFATTGGAASRVINSGNDTALTTVGLNIGAGSDLIVGREVSLGLDITFHYLVPKKIATSGGAFDLGSSYVTVGLRLNF